MGGSDTDVRSQPAPARVRGRRPRSAGEPLPDRIFRIASELFAQRGYDATGIHELTEAIGLGRGALYHHIRSKEDLLFEICVLRHREVLEQAERIVAVGSTVEERIRALARDLIVQIAQQRASFTVSLSELRALSPERRAQVVALRSAYESIWTRLLDEGVAEGTLRPTPPIVLRGVLGLLRGTHEWISATGPMTPEEIADAYVDFMLRSLREERS